MKHKPIVALDLGSTKVACVVARPRSEGLGMDILGSGVARHPLPTTTWPCEPAVIGRTVERALEEADVMESLDRAWVAVTHPALSHHRVAAQIELAAEPVPIRERVVQRLKAQATAQSLGIDRDVLLLEPLGYQGNGFDGAIDPRGLLATRLKGQFQLVAIPVAVRRAIVHGLEIAGLEAERVVYGVRASAAACFDGQASAQRVLLIDLGGCSTDLAVVEQGRITHSCTVPWGGATVIDAVAMACRLPLEQALAASLEGLASPKPEIREILERELDVLHSGISALLQGVVPPDRAVVTGGGALIDGLVEWVERATGIPSVLGRSPHAQRFGDVARQVALTAALGLLVPTASGQVPLPSRTPRLLNRLFQGTKTVLTEYF